MQVGDLWEICNFIRGEQLFKPNLHYCRIIFVAQNLKYSKLDHFCVYSIRICYLYNLLRLSIGKPKSVIKF